LTLKIIFGYLEALVWQLIMKVSELQETVFHVQTDYLSDLWMLNTKSLEWVWISGPDTTDNGGIYGTKYVASRKNNPGARQFCSSSPTGMVDKYDNLWLFGGYGFPELGEGKISN
jgi:hypothetical protein